MIAGIGKQTSGKVLIGGRDVSDVEPGDRGVAMVFQNYAILLSWRPTAILPLGMTGSGP
jgi:ABC-type sugar transport system ATPase subunit